MAGYSMYTEWCAKKMGYAICERCKKRFIKRAGNQRFCSESCRRGVTITTGHKQPKTQPAQDVLAKCDHCGKEFHKKGRHHQRFCSASCCNDSNRERISHGRYVIFERDNFRCFYCGKSSYGDGKELHVDHVFPRSSGGEDVASNLVTACTECNLQKHKREIREIDPLLAEIERRNKAAGILPKTIIKLTGKPSWD